MHGKLQLVAHETTSRIIGAAIEVHKSLGPGYLESVYEEAMCIEFQFQQVRYVRQKQFQIFHRDVLIARQRLDLIVEDLVVVELKAVENFEEIHFATVKSYLKGAGLKVGLLLNFNKAVLSVKRFVM